MKMQKGRSLYWFDNTTSGALHHHNLLRQFVFTFPEFTWIYLEIDCIYK